MARLSFEVPSEIEEILSRHPEIQWERLVRDTLWSYAKKIQVMDKITSKSRLTEQDVVVLDKAIKATLLEKYRPIE